MRGAGPAPALQAQFRQRYVPVGRLRVSDCAHPFSSSPRRRGPSDFLRYAKPLDACLRRHDGAVGMRGVFRPFMRSRIHCEHLFWRSGLLRGPDLDVPRRTVLLNRCGRNRERAISSQGAHRAPCLILLESFYDGIDCSATQDRAAFSEQWERG